tara:strand:+ start:44624 stop:46048 length:1425 start_codon:yes stop_codon:yes gene_type:complete
MNLDNFLKTDELIKAKDQIKKIFFYRICGTGMGACACLLKEAGFDVHGADSAFFPPMSTYLESTGIPLRKLDEMQVDDFKDYDLIVVGNSVPRMSDQARMIEELGIKFTSFPALLGAFVLKDREVIGLAGTHGKTTTTFFIQQILENLGEECGYLIGGILNNRPPAELGKSKYFVIESDEYDSAYFQKISKFRLYELNHMVLTSLEFDHADIYDSVEQIENEFSHAFKAMNGVISFDNTYPSAVKLSKEHSHLKWIPYGDQIEITKKSSTQTTWTMKKDDKSYEFSSNVIGRHNILNLSGCLELLLELGFEYDKLKLAIENLSLVKRRQEERGVYKGSLVIDDFAHHPRAVSLTIEAIRDKYPNRKVITVFEPISATARSSIFQSEFTQALANSDKVIMATNPLKTTVKSSHNLDTDLIVTELKKKNIPAINSTDLQTLRKSLDEFNEENAILLILSNRTCLGLWESDFVQALT